MRGKVGGEACPLTPALEDPIHLLGRQVALLIIRHLVFPDRKKERRILYLAMARLLQVGAYPLRHVLMDYH